VHDTRSVSCTFTALDDDQPTPVRRLKATPGTPRQPQAAPGSAEVSAGYVPLSTDRRRLADKGVARWHAVGMGNGIPAEAFEFYEHLAADNTRAFWADHKDEYARDVRQPLQELADSIAPDFGPAHLYRPYRDMRFSRDKTPYKDHQGCVFEADNGLGWYLQVSAVGFMVAGGWHSSTPVQVKRYREHILESGAVDLRAAMRAVTRSGFEIDGERLKTRPRGVAEDSPDLDLLRHRTLHATRMWEPAAWMGTRRLQTTVHKAFEKMRPMLVVLADIVGPAE